MCLVDLISLLNLLSAQSEIYLNYRNKLCFILLNVDYYDLENKEIQVN